MDEKNYVIEDEHVLSKELVDSISELNLTENNIGGKEAHLRDTFLNAEKKYVLELLKDDDIKNLVRDVNNFSSEELFAVAEELVDKVENNLISYEEMEKVEKELIILLAAIKDKVLEKVLELYPDFETTREQGFGRSR